MVGRVKGSDDDDGAIHRLDTVPPPDGAADPYNAPTRVGPMSDAAVDEMLQAAQARASTLGRRPAEVPVPVAAAAARQASRGARVQELPRLYGEDGPHDVDDAATTEQNVENPPALIESRNRTAPIPRAVAASVVAAVDARQAAMPQAVVPAPSRSPWVPPPDPPWPNISTLQLVCAGVLALALFIAGLIAFLRSRGVL
jgi:hypothetical protein